MTSCFTRPVPPDGHSHATVQHVERPARLGHEPRVVPRLVVRLEPLEHLTAPTVPVARGGRIDKNATCRKESQGSTGGPGADPPVRPSQEVEATLTMGG